MTILVDLSQYDLTSQIITWSHYCIWKWLERSSKFLSNLTGIVSFSRLENNWRFTFCYRLVNVISDHIKMILRGYDRILLEILAYCYRLANVISDHIEMIWASCLTLSESRPPLDWTNLRSSFPESRSEFLSTTKRIGDVGERFSEPEWRLGGPIENSEKI